MRFLIIAICMTGTAATAMSRETCVAALADAYEMEEAISEIVREGTKTARIYSREGSPGIEPIARAMTNINVQMDEAISAYQDALFELCKASPSFP